MKQIYKSFLSQLWIALCCLLLANGALMAQERTISGKITTANGEGLPGVSVLAKGTSVGSVSDVEGNYSMKLPNGVITLIISSVGYKTQEIQVGDQSTIDFQMEEDVENLQEIVVTALGIEKDKKAIGYATQSVQGEDLVKAREPNVINTLTGKIAGLVVGQSAELLGNPQVILRGNANLLYVVDGVPINSDTWNISADDIDTYTVLKGPTASALYGSRAQFGAIMITTKRGSKDKRGFSVDFNSSTMFDKGFLAIPKTQDLYGPGDHGVYEFVDGRGGGKNDGDYDIWGPKFNGQSIPQYDSPIVNGVRQGTPWVARGKDNLKRFLQTGILSTNNIAVSASGEKYDLRFSVSHSYQRGIVPNTKLNITNFNISGGFSFSPKLRLETNLNFNRQYTPNFPDVQYGPNSMIYNITIWGGADWNVDDMKNYWQPGKEGVQQIYAEYQRYNNPWFLAKEWLRGHYKTDIFGYVALKYKITDNLELMGRSQVTTYNLLRTEKFPYSATVYGRELAQGDYREDRRNLFENNTDVLLTYNKNVIPDLSVRASLGGAIRSYNYNSNYTTTDYLNVPGLYNFNNSKNPVKIFNYNAPMEVWSGYYSVDLGYKNFLFLTTTGRIDRQSTLPTGKNVYFYPSVSLSAVLSDVIDMPKFISLLKIRSSYANVKGALTQARIGATPTASFPLGYGSNYESSYDGPSYANSANYSTPLQYNNQPSAYYANQINNPNIKPFESTTYEIGGDIRFFQNRLGLDITYFSSLNGPNIFSLPVSQTSGYTSQLVNGIKTQKHGLEITLTGTPLKSAKGLNWNVLVNWSTYKETFKEFYPGIDTYDTYYKTGDRVDGYYSRAFARTQDGQIINDDSGRPIRLPVSQFLGFTNPDWVWSFINKFTYKNISLSFQLDGRVGGVMVDYIQRQTFRGGRNIATTEGAMGIARENDVNGIKSYVGEGVKIVGGSPKYDAVTGQITNYNELTFAQNDIKQYLQDYIATYYGTDEGNIISKTYAKLREVTIGYTLPQAWLSKTFIRQASISFVGRNLLYFAKVKDVDIDQYPNNNYSTLQTPTTRRFGFNINVTF